MWRQIGEFVEFGVSTGTGDVPATWAIHMRVGLRGKLFLALLATLVLTVAATGIAARITFIDGFLGYLNAQELERIDRMVPSLAVAYSQYGNWDFVRDDPRAWFNVLRGIPVDDAQPFFPDETFEVLPEPPRLAELHISDSDLTGTSLRMGLMDAEHHFVAGNPDVPSDAPERPIRLNGRVVGYLVVLPFQRVTAGAAAHLKDQQLVSTWIIEGGAVLLAALVASGLTHRLLAPTQRLATAMHRLAAGDYATRLTIASRDELGQLAGDLNRLALTLQRNEQMRRGFVADVSHELRTPLAVLRGELEAIEDSVRPLTPESLSSLQGEVATLGKLVDDLFDLSLADVGALSYRMTDLDIAALLRLRLKGIGERLAERCITLDVDVPRECLLVRADPTRLHQLVNNLVENSRRYTNAGGRARLTCRGERTNVVIEVEDSEPGVPANLLPRLFDRFYRVEASRSRGAGGAGLGLAICKSIVEAHDGTIVARNSTLGGLLVTVTLPSSRVVA